MLVGSFYVIVVLMCGVCKVEIFVLMLWFCVYLIR
jgi:hypothetical protein